VWSTKLPHCIIEHTDNIKDYPVWVEVLKEIHKILVDTGEINESDIKSRVVEHKNYYIGDGNQDQAFITLKIEILDGRSDQFKKEVAQNALKALSKYFEKTLKDLQTSISVQISDIHRKSYSKIINY
jgi:5-carboxymethyl-2-hydroxymuconate isomerase